MVKDVVDPVLDERLAEFVVDSHMRAHPLTKQESSEGQKSTNTLDKDILPQDLLRKYVTYAKQNCRPKLQNADYDKIATVSFWSSFSPVVAYNKMKNCLQEATNISTKITVNRLLCAQLLVLLLHPAKSVLQKLAFLGRFYLHHLTSLRQTPRARMCRCTRS